MEPGERGLKRVIVTADDFGLSVPVNEAVENAHHRGILTTTCLMVGEAAVADAVARATAAPDLAVGLHVTVVCGRSVLPHELIPDLVDAEGRFDTNLVRAGVRYFFLPRVRRQLAAEIEAQFAAFQKTGLELDHINTHNHMHMHPTVLALMIKIGRKYGATAIRVPSDPSSARSPAERMGRLFLAPWLALLKRQVRRAGFRCNDHIFGIRDSGQMDKGRLVKIFRALPDGVTEVFSHPATGRWDGIDPAAMDYRFEEEYEALLDPDVRRTLEATGASLISYRNLL